MIRCDWCEKMVTWVVSCLCRRVVCRDCAETHGCGTMETLEPRWRGNKCETLRPRSNSP